jgi:hypothetical protein
LVITDRFAWAHLPKTGGDATSLMLRSVRGLVRFADTPDSEDKHLPFFARESEIAGRLLVMNIRRLPEWALSGAHHKSAHGLHPEYRPLPLESADEITSRTDADDLLRWMTDGGRFAVDRWLRAEALEHDLLTLLDDIGALTPEARQAIAAVGRVNVGAYDRKRDAPFTAQQVARLYRLNPGWAAVERAVYGDVPA